VNQGTAAGLTSILESTTTVSIQAELQLALSEQEALIAGSLLLDDLTKLLEKEAAASAKRVAKVTAVVTKASFIAERIESKRAAQVVIKEAKQIVLEVT
jgi:hypothetical protein